MRPGRCACGSRIIPRGDRLVNLISDEHSRAGSRGAHEIALDAYGFRWFRVGGADDTLIRTAYGPA
jgi:maltose alpha-D-glucosyltransferase / alpha-amylase